LLLLLFNIIIVIIIMLILVQCSLYIYSWRVLQNINLVFAWHW